MLFLRNNKEISKWRFSRNFKILFLIREMENLNWFVNFLIVLFKKVENNK